MNNSDKPKQYVSNVLTINASNYAGNSKYVYKLPNGVNFKEGDQVLLSSMSIYNSTFNISSVYGNNWFEFYFPPTNTWYRFTIPDGYYSIDDLNLFFQLECTRLNLYARKGSNVVYFGKLSTNLNQYKAQVDNYVIPSALDNSNNQTSYGYTVPTPGTGGVTWNFIANTRTTNFTFATGFGRLLGFTTKFLTRGSTTLTTNQSTLSDIYPSLSPIFNYIVTCNLVHSLFNLPPNILNQIPIESSFGSLITYKGSSDSALSIAPGTYNEIWIQLLDQNYNTLPINDPESTFTLILKYQV